MELARCAICGEEHPPAERVTLRNEAEDAPAGARGEFPAARWRRVPDDELTGERWQRLFAWLEQTAQAMPGG